MQLDKPRAPARQDHLAPSARSLLVGELAPAFEGAPLAGRARVRLADYRGTVVVLAFWASWSPACKLSLPWLERLHREHQGAGLEVIGVNVDEKGADARAFMKRHRAHFPIVSDTARTIATLYDVTDLPTSFLIDRTSTVRYAHAGFRRTDATPLKTRLAALLREGPLG